MQPPKAILMSSTSFKKYLMKKAEKFLRHYLASSMKQLREVYDKRQKTYEMRSRLRIMLAYGASTGFKEGSLLHIS